MEELYNHFESEKRLSSIFVVPPVFKQTDFSSNTRIGEGYKEFFSNPVGTYNQKEYFHLYELKVL